MTDAEPVLIYTTFPDAEVARNITAQLIERGLIACANLFPGMTAVYRWEGRVETGTETAALLKTTTRRSDEVIAAIEELHPYDVPAALVVPCSGGSEPFADWIKAETAGGTNGP